MAEPTWEDILIDLLSRLPWGLTAIVLVVLLALWVL